MSKVTNRIVSNHGKHGFDSAVRIEEARMRRLGMGKHAAKAAAPIAVLAAIKHFKDGY